VWHGWRGGSWGYVPHEARCANRRRNFQHFPAVVFRFRVVCSSLVGIRASRWFCYQGFGKVVSLDVV
jgi:hypothetical protein